MIDITEADFAAWKHHPVTKIWLKFLEDYATVVGGEVLGAVCGSLTAPDPFYLGEIKGRFLVVSEMAEPRYESIVKFYQPQETIEDNAA